MVTAPNGICRPSFRVAWGTQHLRQRHLEVGVSCSLKIVLVVRETERGGKREIERQRKERKKGRKKGQNEKKHKRETNKWTKKRKTASELDATWYGNCRKESTTGWISLISFAHSVNVQNTICLAHARFTEHSWLVQGCLSLFKGTPNCVPTVRAHLWQKSYKILQD